MCVTNAALKHPRFRYRLNEDERFAATRRAGLLPQNLI